ncbi:response regulator transcription factor [Streptomyces spongiae]|uniref:Response regulator transcription factor n=2 Tax=Streptomyces spongiae TaxID=565072 RepID=A0A5N8XN49_9ACTN|nr:response regulator transcription factor [Streptomyces spongiae]
MAERPVPVLMICPATDTRHIPAALRLGVTGCLVEGDYRDSALRSALWSTAAGHTHLSPAAAATLGGVAPLYMNRGPGRDGGRPHRLLSGREQQIMDLLAHGLRPTEIGQRLSIAVKTVRNNLSDIYGKLGVSGRTQAVLLWLDA